MCDDKTVHDEKKSEPITRREFNTLAAGAAVTFALHLLQMQKLCRGTTLRFKPQTGIAMLFSYTRQRADILLY
jgi:hypothetical protein